MGIGRRTKKEWSEIQKSAWARRREREAERDKRQGGDPNLVEELTTAVRLAGIEKALRGMQDSIEYHGRMIAALKANFDHLSGAQQQPERALVGPETMNHNRALIDAASRVLHKMYTGQSLGMLDYDALKKGVREAENT